MEGIVIDLNKITARQLSEWRKVRRAMLKDGRDDEIEEFNFKELYQRIIVSWSFGKVTFDNYLDQTLAVTKEIDAAVNEALTAQKK